MSETHILDEPDKEVWVVEENSGSGWRVSAVLSTFRDAERYEKELREFHEEMRTQFSPETIKTRHGGRKSPTKMFESYPPEDTND